MVNKFVAGIVFVILVIILSLTITSVINTSKTEFKPSLMENSDEKILDNNSRGEPINPVPISNKSSP